MAEPLTLQHAALDARSRALRRRIVDTLRCSGRGHVGSAFSIVEILRVLYDDVLRYEVADPASPARDRFILSKGHGCLALYVLLAEKNFFPEAELERFSSFDGILGGHPESGRVPGVETSTGSLGHGPAFGIGMAVHARRIQAPHRIFVLVGDGECNEGSVWEAAMIAAKYRLDNFTIIVDYNRMQSYGPTSEVQELEPFAGKWRSFGFAVAEIDGHDVAALRDAFSILPLNTDMPSCIICHTVKGRGIPFAENNPGWHHKNKLTGEECAQLYAALED